MDDWRHGRSSLLGWTFQNWMLAILALIVLDGRGGSHQALKRLIFSSF